MELHLTNLVPDQIIKALCNTLIHSLWQGIILAIITGITIVLTKKSGAALRYNLMIAYLLLFSAAIAVTFYKELPSSGATIVQHASFLSPTPPMQTLAYHQHTTEKQANIITTGIGYFNTHANTIVLIWFLIICARCVQFAVGLQSIYYIKRTKVIAAGAYWENKLTELANSMAIKRTVCILQSGITKVPMVIGHLKPVILIPIGLLTALSAEEVESILLHELAHIRRKDFLVNLLQNLMEIIFFFNPAVLWVSALIKAERENCCDDMVIAQTSSKVNYLKALVSCEEYQSAAPAYAMGLGGKDGHLLLRVKRMLSNNNQTLNRVEKMVLTICLITAVLITAAFSKSKIESRALKIKHENNLVALHKITSAGEVLTNKSDTLKNKAYKIYKSHEVKEGAVTEYTNTDRGQHLFVFKKAGALYEYTGATKDIDVSGTFYVNGSAVPKDRVAEYLSIFEQEKIENDVNNEKIKAVIQNSSGDTKLFLQKLQKEENNTNDTILKLMRRGAAGKPDSDEVARLRDKLAKMQAQHEADSIKLSQATHYGIDYNTPSGSYGYNQSGRKRESNNYSGRYSYNYVPSDGPEPTGVIIPDFGDTLVKYGVIKDKRHIHATFNSNGLIINGVKHPDEVFQMLFKKYGENTNITYTNNGLPDRHMEQQAYWTAQQKKMIDQMLREGLITDPNIISFTLTTKTFVINGLVQSDEVFERYRREYVPADAGDNWNWNYHNIPGDYPAYGSSYHNSGSSYQLAGSERREKQAEIDKKLVTDLLQDGLISDPKNVTFILTDKKLTINGKRQNADTYKKYKDKYLPNNNGGSWSWTYGNHQ